MVDTLLAKSVEYGAAESGDAIHAGTDELLRLKQAYVMPCVYHFFKNPPHIVRGEGSWLIDHEGKRYLDCYSGVTVMSAGHCNDEIIEPVIEQIRTLQHTTTIYLTEPVLKLAEKLASILPGDLKRSFFCASGSEAVEAALLLASLHTQRKEIIAFDNGLHGRTRWAINATGLPMWRTDPFPLSHVHHVPFGDTHALANCLAKYSGRIAAVIGEPIQGNGGIVIPPDDFWPSVRRLTAAHNTLLIMDEIQTGFGRTGQRFACEHWNVTPDVICLSKAMGNGFPIAATVTTDAIAQSYTRPGASTYGGNPVCAAAALATIDYHERHALHQCARDKGKHLLQKLRDVAESNPHFRNPRAMGLMGAVDVVDTAGDPDPSRLDAWLESLKDGGVLVGKTGPDRNVLTLLPPLTISDDEIGVLTNALHQYCD